MKSTVVRFPGPKEEPTLEQLVERVRELAADTHNIRMDPPHCRSRMAERGVTMRQLLEVLRRGNGVDGPTLDEYGAHRIKLKRRVAGRRVQVVVAVKQTHVDVVTVI